MKIGDQIREARNRLGTIPSNGIQYVGSGMPVQAITHMGILIKGTDANGNELQFRTLVQFSQELAE